MCGAYSVCMHVQACVHFCTYGFVCVWGCVGVDVGVDVDVWVCMRAPRVLLFVCLGLFVGALICMCVHACLCVLHLFVFACLFVSLYVVLLM